MVSELLPIEVGNRFPSSLGLPSRSAKLRENSPMRTLRRVSSGGNPGHSDQLLVNRRELIGYVALAFSVGAGDCPVVQPLASQTNGGIRQHNAELPPTTHALQARAAPAVALPRPCFCENMPNAVVALAHLQIEHAQPE